MELDHLQSRSEVELVEKDVEALSWQADALSSTMDAYKEHLHDSLLVGRTYSARFSVF